MKKNKKTTALLFAVVLFVMALSLTAFASTTTQAIELETRSALLIDRSGSMEEQKAIEETLAQIDQSAFDTVVYFDHRLSTEDSFTGGGNSSICETLNKIATGGFTHIILVTDGEQWPQDYSSLGVYTDLDLTIHLVEEDEESQEFINQLESRLTKSNLKVVKQPDGSEKVILDDYQAPIYPIEIPVVENNISEDKDEGDTFIENIQKGYFPWWLVLILAVLIAALFDFIHELITRGRRAEKEEVQQPASAPTGTVVAPTPKPMPAKAVAQIAQGVHIVADFSGSMAAQQSETAKACMEAQKGSEAVICFGDTVSEHTADELKGIQATGKTHGWEAMEQAATKGWDEIVLVSDLGFNGKMFDKNAFTQKFKKVTVVTPSKYHEPTLENIKKIADEVEVLHL